MPGDQLVSDKLFVVFLNFMSHGRHWHWHCKGRFLPHDLQFNAIRAAVPRASPSQRPVPLVTGNISTRDCWHCPQPQAVTVMALNRGQQLNSVSEMQFYAHNRLAGSWWQKLDVLQPDTTRKNIQSSDTAFWKVPRLRPFVLLVRTTIRWRCVWSNNGMILTGENWRTANKICPSVILPTTTLYVTWPGIEPGHWRGKKKHHFVRKFPGLARLSC